MEIIVMIAIGLIVAVYILRPLSRSQPPGLYDWDGSKADELAEHRRADIERDVMLYREALRAGTVCTRCGQANKTDSRFCADCGRPLRNARQPEAEPEPVSG